MISVPVIDRSKRTGEGNERPSDWNRYVENKPIMQPFGDRSKVVIEPMLTDQWFVDAAKVVEPAHWRPCAMAADQGSSRKAAKKPITTGWKTSNPGASPASSGGATRCRFGMGP